MTNRFLSCIEKIHNYFDRNKTPDVDTEKQILYRSIKLTEEVGELNNRLFLYLWKGQKEKLEKFEKKYVDEEFADVIIAVYLLAKSCNVDVDHSINKKMKILEERFGV